MASVLDAFKALSCFPQMGLWALAYLLTDANEMGLQTFRYSILPHRKSWKEAKTYLRAAEINMPLAAMELIRD